MLKKIIIASIAISFLTFSFVFATIASSGNIVFELCSFNIKLGNSDINVKNTAYLKDNSIYVPLRGICNELGMSVSWNNEKKEATIDKYSKKVNVSHKTVFKEEGVIPDEEIALIVGKTILEKYAGRNMEYESDENIYYLTVIDCPEENAWIVVQNFERKNPMSGGSTDYGDFANVKISKSTGEVIYINTYSTYETQGDGIIN